MTVQHRYWWLSMASYYRTTDSWSFTDTVSKDQHPFELVRLNNEDAGSGRTAGFHWVLMSFRVISVSEYRQHPEAG